MNRLSRPIWKLLIVVSESDQSVKLTCDECFNILDYLADEAIRGIDLNVLREALHRHIEHCEDCREHHLKKLEGLEVLLTKQTKIK